jgi:hypothetical protein
MPIKPNNAYAQRAMQQVARIGLAEENMAEMSTLSPLLREMRRKGRSARRMRRVLSGASLASEVRKCDKIMSKIEVQTMTRSSLLHDDELYLANV